jgi:hypothetical protein
MPCTRVPTRHRRRPTRDVALAHVLAHIVDHPRHPVVFEYRPPRYRFGAVNYGEVVGWRNPADGDCWDVFAPGYERPLPMRRTYAVRSVLGVFRLDNGNHKIAVRLHVPGYDAQRAATETERYVACYVARTRHTGAYEPLTAF